MPVHDWTRVDTGDFHDFHQGWMVELRKILNQGVLPTGFYAQVERCAGEAFPDVLALERDTDEGGPHPFPAGSATVLTSPPRVSVTASWQDQVYVAKKNRIAIYQQTPHRLVAMVELISPGNKSSAPRLRQFVNKALSAIQEGVHLLLLDILPPTRRDPHGLHGIMASEIGGEDFTLPPGKSLTLAAYVADLPIRAYVEPLAVGDQLAPMPLYLSGEHYVLAPLQEAYDAAFAGLPSPIQAVLATR